MVGEDEAVEERRALLLPDLVILVDEARARSSKPTSSRHSAAAIALRHLRRLGLGFRRAGLRFGMGNCGEAVKRPEAVRVRTVGAGKKRGWGLGPWGRERGRHIRCNRRTGESTVKAN